MSDSEKPKCRVVIVGAGPAGLLAAINFYGARVPSSMKWTWWKEARATVLLDAAGLEKQRSARVDDSSQHPRPGRLTHLLTITLVRLVIA